MYAFIDTSRQQHHGGGTADINLPFLAADAGGPRHLSTSVTATRLAASR